MLCLVLTTRLVCEAIRDFHIQPTTESGFTDNSILETGNYRYTPTVSIPPPKPEETNYVHADAVSNEESSINNATRHRGLNFPEIEVGVA